MKTNICSVLISTCDKYEDAWKPFFFFFHKYWKDCPYQVYLNTETKKCDFSDVITINCSNKDNASWSLRLKKALKTIDTKYVIFLLEDFFLLSDVDQKEIDRAIKIMEDNKDISVIDFERVPRIKSNPSDFGRYVERDISAMYFLNCQSAIWRKKDLIKYLSPYESPWQFELFGSNRARLYGKKFLLQENESKPVFNYNVNWNNGYGIFRSKWLKSNINLFKNNDIKVDFSKLGFYENNSVDMSCPTPKKCLADRWIYFCHGGGSPYIGISEWISYLFKNPRKFLSITKEKIKFVLTDYRG